MSSDLNVKVQDAMPGCTVISRIMRPHRTHSLLSTVSYMCRDFDSVTYLGQPLRSLGYADLQEILSSLEPDADIQKILKAKPHFAEWTKQDLEQLREYDGVQSYFKDIFPCPETWLAYLQNTNASLSEYVNCYKYCRFDFKSHSLCLNALTEKLEAEQKYEEITNYYLDLLSVPHKNLESVYEDLSQHVSKHNPDQYVNFMRQASKLKNQSDKKTRHYVQHETEIANENLPRAWCDYITLVAKYRNRKNDFNEVSALFYRSLFENGSYKILDGSWFSVWETFLSFARNDPMCDDDWFSFFVTQCVRCNPLECRSYVWYCKGLKEDDSIAQVEQEVTRLGLWKSSSYSSWLRLAEQILLNFDTEDEAVSLAKLELDGGDFSYGITEYALDKVLSPGSVKQIVQHIQKKVPLSSRLWTKSFCASLAKGADYKTSLEFLEENVVKMDSPQDALLGLLSALRNHGHAKQRQVCWELYERLITEIPKSVKRVEVEDKQADVENKRQKSEVPVPEDPKRSREQFRILMSNLPQEASEDDIRLFLSGYGSPASVYFRDDISGKVALVELSSEKEVLTCLVRNNKQLNDYTVSIERVFGNTVWVTNYSPYQSPSDIKHAFAELCPDFLSIRLPSQNDKKERRFLYLDFISHKAASDAQKRLDGYDFNGYTLHAEISNPTLKKPRSGPDVNKQIYVHNMNFKKTDEASLREFFSKYGVVESVSVPVNEKNASLGHKNNGYAFVTFATADSAKQALHIENPEIDGRPVKISPVKTKETLSTPRVSEFEPLRTISLGNLNTTVTSEFLKTFLQERIGPVERIQLKPSKRAALVEFQNTKDAGIAAMKLEGVVFEEETLRVGSKADFFKEAPPEPTTKKPTMVPPMLMRRRR